MKKIILMRHGKVAVNSVKAIGSDEFSVWLEAYDNSGIDANVPPGCLTHQMIKKCDAVVCSGLKRSADSVSFCHKTPLETDHCFNEAGLPFHPAFFPKLTPNIRALLFRIGWLLGYSNNSESHTEANKRAEYAAGRLIELSKKHGTVLLMGHGVMNRLIAKKLKHKGWRVKKRLQNGYWGYGIFEKKE